MLRKEAVKDVGVWAFWLILAVFSVATAVVIGWFVWQIFERG